MDGVWSQIEELIERSDSTWTFVRAGGFAANTLSWAEQVRSGDVVSLTVPGAARSLVHERDIADVAVEALIDPEHRGRAYDVTGPEILTQAEQVELLAESLGRNLRVKERSRQEVLDDSTPADREFVGSAIAHWESLVDDPETVRTDSEQITGHPARSYAQWAHDHAEDFSRLSLAQVAHRYAEGFRTGRIERSTSLLARDVVRLAPMENDGEEVEVIGLANIMKNAEAVDADLSLEAVEVGDPLLADGRFAIRFVFHELHLPTGQRRQTTKMSLCTVENSRIVREEVFYYSRPR